MVITHHGGQCFKVTFGDLTLVFDPIAKGASLPAVRFGADIALVSRDHPDMNGVEEVTYGDPSNPLRAGKVPFAITGPGEYERQGVVIQGFLSKSKYPTSPQKATKDAVAEYMNTIYSMELEDMTLVHLGALTDTELSKEARESIDEIDVLFVPIGGNGVLTPTKAHELAVSLEPKIIIPMHWSGIGQPKALDAFLKEAGNGSEKTDKLTLKKKDLTGRDGSILILTP
ncbi:MBL fold metallo-hydrolase [Candidatus Kaiserbacteria bacterium]|nr:MBL fold metallo-hydrolase [Candidatus Kaiserbacteria bacterium]